MSLIRRIKNILKSKIKTIDWRFVKSPKFYLPLLAVFSILLSLVIEFVLVQQRRSLYQKAAFEEELAKQSLTEPKISEWVPIDLAWFNQTHDEEIKSLQAKLSSLDKETLSAVEKEREKDVLQRSIQIYQIEKEEYNAMDENKDGKIDYQEFNKRTVEVYEKTYPLRHTKVKDKPEGLFDGKWNLIDSKTASVQSSNTLMVIVEGGIYDQILPSLQQYKTDVELTSNYRVNFYPCNNCLRESLKDLLRTPGISGAVFVGDLPTAWFRTYLNNITDYFPIDLYYMDLNGFWGGKIPCGGRNLACYSEHDGNVEPEIFVGRITAPIEESEVGLITNYFRKNHNFRLNGSLLPHKMLNYIDDDWNQNPAVWLEIANLVYSNVDNITDPFITNANDYKERLDEGYEQLLLAVHSNPLTHDFIVPGDVSPQATIVNYNDIKSLKPHFYLYNLFACSNARFTDENYMAGWYVFQESDYGLLAVGSTKEGAMTQFEQFYTPLSLGKDFGTAFKEWFSNHALNKSWHGGMTLIGDPTLKIVTPSSTLTPVPIGSSKESLCGEPCKPGYFCRCERQTREGDGGGCFCVKE